MSKFERDDLEELLKDGDMIGGINEVEFDGKVREERVFRYLKRDGMEMEGW